MKNVGIRDTHGNRSFITFQAPSEKKLLAYLLCSAICHQTHNLKNADKNLIGWNYLEHVFEKLAIEESSLLDLKYLYEMSNHELQVEFEKLFPESETNSKSSLDRIEERINLIKNVVHIITSAGYNSIHTYFKRCDGYLYNNGTGLYETLSNMEAFKDPLKKKSTLFIKLLDQSGLINVKDPEHYEPLMDYHMQRLLLRTGCVKVQDSKLEFKLKRRKPIESDEIIRKECITAIKEISNKTGISVLDLDDLFWAIGRSCCKEKTLCRDKHCNKNPCTFEIVSNIEKHEFCIFEGVCLGSLEEEYQSFWEPQVSTSYY